MKERILKVLYVTIISLWCCSTIFAGLQSRVDAIIGAPSQSKVTYSVVILDAATGRNLYKHNANAALIPASNMKLVISAAALKYLGGDYQYVTKVGMLNNSLIVTGSGDPLLGDKKTDDIYGRKGGWVFDAIMEAIREQGIEKVGDIIVDTTVFDDERVNPNWPVEQLNNWYAAEVSGVNYNVNCIDLTTVNNGGRVIIEMDPVTKYVKLRNEVAAASDGKGAVGAYRQSGKPNELLVRGKCSKKQGPFSVTVERPGAFLGYMIYEHMTSNGIEVTGRLLEQGVEEKSYVGLCSFETSIWDVMRRCNKDSLQLAAEAMLKTISAEKTQGKGGNWAHGREIISEYLMSLGISSDQFRIDDASGLSRENRLSAASIAAVLRDVYQNESWDKFKATFAVGGVDGTLVRYFKQGGYQGKVMGKTGYISGVMSFSGVCETARGEILFSIITNNNWQGRKYLNDITIAVIDEFGSPVE